MNNLEKYDVDEFVEFVIFNIKKWKDEWFYGGGKEKYLAKESKVKKEKSMLTETREWIVLLRNNKDQQNDSIYKNIIELTAKIEWGDETQVFFQDDEKIRIYKNGLSVYL